MSDFQGDVLHYSTDDGGEILLDDNNVIINDTGFDTAIYYSLFGGNDLDNGNEATKKFEYWGNKLEANNPERKLISRTQNILTGFPATIANLNKVNQAIKDDLKWMIDELIIDELNITLSMPSRNKINIEINGIKDKAKIFGVKYEKNWLSKLS